jgi:hypothetical protein
VSHYERAVAGEKDSFRIVTEWDPQELMLGLRVPETRRIVRAARGQPFAIGADRHRSNPILMGQAGALASRLNVPEASGSIITGGS